MLAETINGAVFDLVVELLGAGGLDAGHDLLGVPAGLQFIPDELRQLAIHVGDQIAEDLI
jgi:hypothetical protein